MVAVLKVGLNGFGRIGRHVLRQGINSKKIEFVAVNFASSGKDAAHLFKYDSVYGKFSGHVEGFDSYFIVNGKKILIFSEREPQKIGWKKFGVELVIECTGNFLTKKEAAQHFLGGAKKVIITAPAKGDEEVPSIVLGVNSEKTKTGNVIDAASCTTNCLMPVLYVLNKNFGIKHSFMTTIHAYTNDQNLVDNRHKDLRRARAAALNIIPTTTGASKASARVLPELKGKVDGIAIRVPVASGSLVCIAAELEKNATEQEINSAMKKASETYLKGILEYSEEPLVSSDIIGNTHSAVFDALSTKVLDKNFVNVLAWYDNEMGYAKRVVELAESMA